MRAASSPFLLVLVALLLGVSARGSEFDAANQLYDAGKFVEARKAYEQLVEHGQWTANLFHNLGNTYHRLEQDGPAILAYERALALEPAHPEALANLKLLRGRTGATPWPASWLDAVFPGRLIAAYVIVVAVAGWLALALVMWISLTPPGDKAGRWFALILAVLAVAYAGMAVWHFEQARTLAIIVAKTAEVRLAPAETSAAGGALPAGSQVRVLSVRGDWTYCLLPEARRGWISSKELERVRLGDS